MFNNKIQIQQEQIDHLIMVENIRWNEVEKRLDKIERITEELKKSPTRKKIEVKYKENTYTIAHLAETIPLEWVEQIIKEIKRRKNE